jgi:hypothetical protein
MKTLIVLALLAFSGCGDEPTTGAEWCLNMCTKQNREMVSFMGENHTCTCGDKIKKECK